MPFTNIQDKIDDMNFKEGVKLGEQLSFIRQDFLKNTNLNDMKKKKKLKDYDYYFNELA